MIFSQDGYLEEMDRFLETYNLPTESKKQILKKQKI